MRRLRRKGRVLKWAGLLSSVLLLPAWAASAFWPVSYWSATRNEGLFLANGGLSFFRLRCDDRDLGIDLFGESWKFRQNSFNWTLDPVQGSAVCWHAKVLRDPALDLFFVPLWSVLLLIAIPTAYLWWRDRRFPPGHCRHCGYDLTGNTSGVCPECGQAVPNRGVSVPHADTTG